MPRSGCILTKLTIRIITVILTNVFDKLIGKGLLYKYAARKTGNAILTISEDCNVKKPRSNHLLHR